MVVGCKPYAPAAFTSRKCSWHSFLLRLSRPQGHSAIGRIMSMKNSSDTIRNRTSDLPACNAVPKPTPPPQAPCWYRTTCELVQSLQGFEGDFCLYFQGGMPCWTARGLGKLHRNVCTYIPSPEDHKRHDTRYVKTQISYCAMKLA